MIPLVFFSLLFLIQVPLPGGGLSPAWPASRLGGKVTLPMVCLKSPGWRGLKYHRWLPQHQTATYLLLLIITYEKGRWLGQAKGDWQGDGRSQKGQKLVILAAGFVRFGKQGTVCVRCSTHGFQLQQHSLPTLCFCKTFCLFVAPPAVLLTPALAQERYRSHTSEPYVSSAQQASSRSFCQRQKYSHGCSQ